MDKTDISHPKYDTKNGTVFELRDFFVYIMTPENCKYKNPCKENVAVFLHKDTSMTTEKYGKYNEEGKSFYGAVNNTFYTASGAQYFVSTLLSSDGGTDPEVAPYLKLSRQPGDGEYRRFIKQLQKLTADNYDFNDKNHFTPGNSPSADHAPEREDKTPYRKNILYNGLPPEPPAAQPPAKPGVSTPPEENKKDRYAEKIASFFIAEINAKTAPWMKPWKADEYLRPENPISKTVYSGLNSLYLETVQRSAYNSDDPRWMTFLQIRDNNYHLKKGSTSCPIAFFSLIPVDKDGKQCDEKEAVRLKTVKKMYMVFHASQIEGMPPYDKLPDDIRKKNSEIIPPVENILKNSGADIVHDSQNRNWYSPESDKIHLTARYTFNTVQDYYSTALHELAHWTGHKTRLDRNLKGKFGSPEYAVEELRAEIASYMLSKDLNTDFNPQNHIAYVKGWNSVLKDNPSVIIAASHDASKIKNYCVSFADGNVKIRETGGRKTKENKEGRALKKCR